VGDVVLARPRQRRFERRSGYRGLPAAFFASHRFGVLLIIAGHVERSFSTGL
jgi:hypothetical protein